MSKFEELRRSAVQSPFKDDQVHVIMKVLQDDLKIIMEDEEPFWVSFYEDKTMCCHFISFRSVRDNGYG